jgi:hypothetical protein
MHRWCAVLAIALCSACSSDSGGPDDDNNVDTGRHLEVHAGATQSGIMGQPTPIAPTVIVTNDGGNPVAGVTVNFSIASGGGSISSATAITGTDGKASVTWTLGRTYASQALNAEVQGGGLVGFLATATGPDAGIMAFNLTDPDADTLAYAGLPAPRALDLIALRGDFKRDSLILTLTFSSSVSDAALGGADGLFGLIEFDIDDRLTTGVPAEANEFGGSASLGIDFLVDLFDEFGLRRAVVHSPTTTDVIPSTFSGNTATVRIPMRLLGNDDGQFSLVGVLGLVDRATDLIPNAGGATIRP